MMNKQTLRRCLTLVAGLSLCTLSVSTAGNKVRIIQTNSAGDNVHVIDPVTNKVVGVVEGKTLKVINKIPLSGHPNNIAIGRDGRRVYVGIIQAPGGVDVIDTASMKNVKTLQTKGSIHNAYVTPDGKYVVAGSIQGKSVNVFDAQTEQPAWTLDMDLGVRPMTFAANPDGSTKWIFVQLSGFNGFAVVDFATRKEINRI